MSLAARTKVLICHSRNDLPWRERLCVYLKPLEHSELIETWDETRTAGRVVIDYALDEVGAIVLLVSADWLASDFIRAGELPRLLERARAEGMLVLPVLVSACAVAGSPLAAVPFVHGTDRPLLALPEVACEAVLLKTADEVLAALGSSAETAPVPIIGARRQRKTH